jgi:hypothetical protein
MRDRSGLNGWQKLFTENSCQVIKSSHETLSHTNSNDVILHEDILDILFKHKGEVHRKFTDLRGIFLIDHIAIKIIDPGNRIVVFSITPSVEYNLIVQGLWKHDLSFSTHFQKKILSTLGKKHIRKNILMKLNILKNKSTALLSDSTFQKKLGHLTLFIPMQLEAKIMAYMNFIIAMSRNYLGLVIMRTS